MVIDRRAGLSRSWNLGKRNTLQSGPADSSRSRGLPMTLRGTVTTLSSDTAQRARSPSCSSRITSVGMLRTVSVIGATVTRLRKPNAVEA